MTSFMIHIFVNNLSDFNCHFMTLSKTLTLIDATVYSDIQ